MEVTYPSKVNLPVRRPAIVRRERLIDHLSGSVQECRVTLINAPAGYGKTTLLLDFAQSAEHPVCWYSLDERDPTSRRSCATSSPRAQQFPDFGASWPQAVASGKTSAPSRP